MVEDKIKNYGNEVIEAKLNECFLNRSKFFDKFSRNVIGYSFEQKSICVIIRNEKGELINVKYRKKFVFKASKKGV
ncbi:MAG: hypothetical protein ACTTJC_02945 [Campylobacter sp.]